MKATLSANSAQLWKRHLRKTDLSLARSLPWLPSHRFAMTMALAGASCACMAQLLPLDLGVYGQGVLQTYDDSGVTGDTQFYTQESDIYSPGEVQSSFNASYSSMSFSGWADTSPGVFKASAYGDFPDQVAIPHTAVIFQTQSYDVDTWTISDSGLDGQSGTIYGSINLSGTLSAYSTQAGPHTAIGALEGLYEYYQDPDSDYEPASSLLQIQRDYGVPGEGPVTTDVNDTVDWSFDFTYGTPFDAGFVLFAQAEYVQIGSELGTGWADSDFSETALWGGVSSITDASGNLVTGANIKTASGQNILVAAPGPESALPFGAGLLGLIRRRRSRR
jgi:hypothetical protein